MKQRENLRQRASWLVVAGLAASSLVACTTSASSDDGPIPGATTSASILHFPAGTTMAKIAERGKLIVGTRFDMPAVAQLDPASGELTGFDADLARYVATQLGLSPDDVEFTEVISANRENALSQGLVDIIVSAYTVTSGRRENVGQAGPYITANTRLFVRQENQHKYQTTDDLAGIHICAPPTSTSAPLIVKFGATLVPMDDNSVCSQQVVLGNVDGKMGNDLAVLGFADQYPELVMADVPSMSAEGWGIGFPKGDEPLCQFLIQTLRDAVSSGAWTTMWDANMAPVGAPAQTPPTPDDHC